MGASSVGNTSHTRRIWINAVFGEISRRIRGLMRPRLLAVAMAAGLFGTAGLAHAEVLVSNFSQHPKHRHPP